MMDAPNALEPTDVPAAAPTGRRWLRAAPLALVALGLVLALAFDAPRYLSIETLRDQRAMLSALVAAHPVQSVVLYIAAYALVVVFALPCALVMTLTGGFLFGTAAGALAAGVGVSFGAVAAFLIARSALGDVIRSRFPEGGRMQRLEARIRANAFAYLLTLRLLPAVPLALVNIAAGFVRMSLSTYVAATILGIIPSCLIYASVGAGLGHVFDRGEALDLSLFTDPEIGLPMLGLVVLSLAPLGLHLYRRRRALPRALG